MALAGQIEGLFPVTLLCDSDCLWQANPTCELLTPFPHFYELNYVSSKFMS